MKSIILLKIFKSPTCDVKNTQTEIFHHHMKSKSQLNARSISSRSASSNSAIREEIQSLLNQKQTLETRRDDLQKRIDALQRVCNYKPSDDGYDTKLDDEYQALFDIIEKQKDEINKLKQTDEAALRQELQEEVKTAYLERMRLQGLQMQQQQDYCEVVDKYNAMKSKEGPEAIQRVKAKIEHYEEVLEKYKRSNHKIKTKIETMKANMAFVGEEGRMKIEKRRDEINSQIEKTKDEIADIEAQIEIEKENHRKKLRDIRLNRTSDKY